MPIAFIVGRAVRVNIKLYLDTKRTESTLLDAALHYFDVVCHFKYKNMFNSTEISYDIYLRNGLIIFGSGHYWNH